MTTPDPTSPTPAPPPDVPTTSTPTTDPTVTPPAAADATAATDTTQTEAQQDTAIRDLATELQKFELSYDPATLIKGTITAIDPTGPPPTLSVQLSGDASTTVAAVRYLDSYSPIVGDVTMIVKQGTDLLAIGRVAQTAVSGWVDASLAAGFTHNANGGGNLQLRKVWDNGAWKVQMKGMVARSSGTTIISALPAGYAPSTAVSMVAARDSSNGSCACKIDIAGSVVSLTDGTMTETSTTLGTANTAGSDTAASGTTVPPDTGSTAPIAGGSTTPGNTGTIGSVLTGGSNQANTGSTGQTTDTSSLGVALDNFNYTSGGSNQSLTGFDNGGGTITNHAHTVGHEHNIGPHGHGMAHTHGVQPHAHTVGHEHQHDHSHTSAAHTHTGAAHTHTSSTHTHTIAHTHTMPHTHSTVINFPTVISFHGLEYFI